ncbi:MAG: LL-diaminopimelate aminotransferase [Prevotellaceae bacterium]|jgi:LL-diaminopimelate aminotransferase|nr:LL-diaminopimelate aminotransferase [Prevotellaceae bacterium]
MPKINENFIKIPASYLFSEVARRVNEYKKSKPDHRVIRMDIGDIKLPLPDACVEAMIKAANEQRSASTFRGYAPDYGYDFLREAIRNNDFISRGVDIKEDEIFISDGAKSDTGNIGDIFSAENRVAVADPAYPVYVDTSAMGGRAGVPHANGQWSDLVYLPCNFSNDFLPALPGVKVDLIYLCSPNNPTGAAFTHAKLAEWVDYARKSSAVILFDAAYEAFITEADVPHSIFEIDGAREVAIEFRSFSKTAGFTGTRCGYTVVPKEVTARNERGDNVSLNALWGRRQSTKFNGTAYVIQRAAEAVYSAEGKMQVKKLLDFYKENAKAIRDGLQRAGYTVFGGTNAPYIWAQTPNSEKSWDYFDYLLKEKNIVVTPGSGFGSCGEGYVRFAAFGRQEDTDEAIRRLTEG